MGNGLRHASGPVQLNLPPMSFWTEGQFNVVFSDFRHFLSDLAPSAVLTTKQTLIEKSEKSEKSEESRKQNFDIFEKKMINQHFFFCLFLERIGKKYNFLLLFNPLADTAQTTHYNNRKQFFLCQWHPSMAFITHYTLQCLFNDNQLHL